MAYRLLGLVVWKGAKWFARRKLGSMPTAKKAVAGGVVGLALCALLVAQRR